MTQSPHKDAILAASIFNHQYVDFSKTYKDQDDNEINVFYEKELTDRQRQLVSDILDKIENATRDHAAALKYGLKREMLKFTDAFMQSKTQNV